MRCCELSVLRQRMRLGKLQPRLKRARVAFTTVAPFFANFFFIPASISLAVPNHPASKPITTMFFALSVPRSSAPSPSAR